MKLLHVDSSILGDNSVSRQISAAIVARLETLHPGLEVTRRDVGASPVSHLSGAYLAGQSADVQHDQSKQTDLEIGGTVLDEFMAADILVIGAPMYNFTIPSQLKSWFDRIVLAGKTFRYTEKGPVGLVSGKRAFLAISRGGFYGPGSPGAALEHQESYVRGTLGFLGIKDVQAIEAEGVGVSPEQRAKALGAALAAAAAIEA